MRVPLSAYGSVDTEVHAHTWSTLNTCIYIYVYNIYETLNNAYTISLLFCLCATAAAVVTTTTAKQQ